MDIIMFNESVKNLSALVTQQGYILFFLLSLQIFTYASLVIYIWRNKG